MIYTSAELASLTGYETNGISKELRKMGYSPVSVGKYNTLEWDEECLEALRKKRERAETENTITLNTLSIMFSSSESSIKKILNEKGIVPLEVRVNSVWGNVSEKYPIKVKEILTKYFDDMKIDKEDEHPLVKDKNCLKLSYWPNIVPKCFEDLDSEVIRL